MSADIDDSILQEIRDLDEETFWDVVRTYLDELPESLHAIEAAISADDAAGLASIAHRLKGASSTMGLLKMAAVCQQLEQGARKGSARQATQHLPALQAGAAVCRARLESYLHD
jgi:HPt (histidine-containing phosphotransfer) domain-containing protein